MITLRKNYNHAKSKFIHYRPQEIPNPLQRIQRMRFQQAPPYGLRTRMEQYIPENWQKGLPEHLKWTRRISLQTKNTAWPFPYPEEVNMYRNMEKL